jgi:hypothetical protein
MKLQKLRDFQEPSGPSEIGRSESALQQKLGVTNGLNKTGKLCPDMFVTFKSTAWYHANHALVFK